jgi:hypothetical protein
VLNLGVLVAGDCEINASLWLVKEVVKKIAATGTYKSIVSQLPECELPAQGHSQRVGATSLVVSLVHTRNPQPSIGCGRRQAPSY